MKAMNPYAFRTADTLDPHALTLNFEQMGRDLDDVLDQRYTYSELLVPWTDLDQADTAEERRVYIKTPATFGAVEIVGAQLVLYGDANAFTVTANNITGWETISATGGGTTTKVTADVSFNATIPADTEVYWEIDSTAGTWTVTRALLALTIRHDRHAGVRPSTYSPIRVAAGDTVSAATLNSAVTDYATDVTSDAANTEQLRITIVELQRNVAAHDADDDEWRIPAFGGYLDSWDTYYVGDGTETATITLRDEANSTLDASTLVGGGSSSTTKDQGQSVDTTQANDDPDDAADDWDILSQFSGLGNTQKAYAVLYWSVG